MASASDALAPEVDAVVAACMEVLRQTPSAVVTDIDGTISAIAPTPAEAMVDPGAKAALASARGATGGGRGGLRSRAAGRRGHGRPARADLRRQPRAGAHRARYALDASR